MSDDGLTVARRCYESARRGVMSHENSLREARERKATAFVEYAKLKLGVILGETVVENRGVKYLVTSFRHDNGLDRLPSLKGRKLKKDGKPGSLASNIWGEWQVLAALQSQPRNEGSGE
jgi:hypothetical protein